MQQVRTKGTTIAWIMSDGGAFACGVGDARRGLGYPPGYETRPTNWQWNYERGRLWACLADPDIEPFDRGRPTSEAVAIYRRAGKLIL